MQNRRHHVTIAASLLLGFVLHGRHAGADHASMAIGAGTAGPINTESGVTISKGHWTAGVRSEYVNFDEFSDEKLIRLREEDPDADLHSVGTIHNLSAGAFYGVTDDLTVGLRLPYVRRTDVREPAGGHDHTAGQRGPVTLPNGTEEDEPLTVLDLGNADGLGDLLLFGQYRFFRRADAHHASLILGVKTPTGDTDVKSAQGFRLETELQPGSGSWDPFFGLAYTYVRPPWTFGSNVLYTVATTGAEDTNLGDILDYNVAAAYRLGRERPHDHGAPPLFAWDLVLEFNGEWRDKLNIAGDINDNSGGNLLYLSPGVRLTLAKKIALAFSFGIPIAEALNGDQVDPQYRLVTLVGFTF
jgi:hypothetical protein